MRLFAHHEFLIAVEYGALAGGSVLWYAHTWWRNRRR